MGYVAGSLLYMDKPMVSILACVHCLSVHLCSCCYLWFGAYLWVYSISLFSLLRLYQLLFDVELLLSNQSQLGAVDDLLEDIRLLNGLIKEPPGNCKLI